MMNFSPEFRFSMILALNGEAYGTSHQVSYLKLGSFTGVANDGACCKLLLPVPGESAS